MPNLNGNFTIDDGYMVAGSETCGNRMASAAMLFGCLQMPDRLCHSRSSGIFSPR